MGLFKKLFKSAGGGNTKADGTVLSEVARAQFGRQLESVIDELKRFDDGMTVEAVGMLEEHGLQGTYNEIWERLLSLHKAVDTETAEKLKEETNNLQRDMESFFARLNKLGISKHIYEIHETWP